MAAKFFAPSRKELRRIAARGRFAVGQRGTAPSTAHVPTEIQTVYGMLERYAAILKKQRPPEMKITGSMVGGRQPGMTHVRGGVSPTHWFQSQRRTMRDPDCFATELRDSFKELY